MFCLNPDLTQVQCELLFTLNKKSYLLRTVYSLWHNRSLLHYRHTEIHNGVQNMGKDTWFHSLFRRIPCHRLYMKYLILSSFVKMYTIHFFSNIRLFNYCRYAIKMNLRIHSFLSGFNLYKGQHLIFSFPLQNNKQYVIDWLAQHK